MNALIKRSIALLPLFAICLLNAGQPLHEVVKLRTIEVLRFEAVTVDNVAEVSGFVRTSSASSGVRAVPSEVAASVPGFLVEGIVRRQRDVTLQYAGGGDPIQDTQWADADSSAPVTFFVPRSHPDACDVFVPGKRVNVVLSQRAECDTYPPAGICAFDHPIRLVDPEAWTKYGE